MIDESSSEGARRLFPEGSVVLVTKSGTIELPPDKLSLQNIGQKAFCLASIPRAWTLPFFSISGHLYREYSTEGTDRGTIVLPWIEPAMQAASQVGIRPDECVLVRSSGSGEGMSARGKFYSASGPLSDLNGVLQRCLKQLVDDPALRSEEIPLIIQRCATPIRTRGHLSNERRCYQEARDWMGEFEAAEAGRSQAFSINLRRWRNKLSLDLTKDLACDRSTYISEVLKAPAHWAFEKQARVHFEWVWNGRTVYLVQADEDLSSGGHNPEDEHTGRSYKVVNFSPKILKQVTPVNAAPFAKLGNVLTYLELGSPCAPLYLLDDQDIIARLANGERPPDLLSDLEELVKGSLVIRTDVATPELEAKQLLPRTDEIRDARAALEWMIDKSNVLTKTRHDCAFIFHNFIPAQSAAFAYADPKSPLVQIESLWGLPEGLYYNSHDQFVVDTLKPNIDSVSASDVSRFRVQERRNFKRFFVSTTPSGKWETLTLKAPYDWKRSISTEVAQHVAYESRRIAKVANRSVSIMWFIGISKEIAITFGIPWYHEAYDLEGKRPALTNRTKTPFDKSFVIETSEDVKRLKREDFVTPQNRIRIQPSDPELLRDKDTLRNIGEVAKAKGQRLCSKVPFCVTRITNC